MPSENKCDCAVHIPETTCVRRLVALLARDNLRPIYKLRHAHLFAQRRRPPNKRRRACVARVAPEEFAGKWPLLGSGRAGGRRTFAAATASRLNNHQTRPQRGAGCRAIWASDLQQRSCAGCLRAPPPAPLYHRTPSAIQIAISHARARAPLFYRPQAGRHFLRAAARRNAGRAR